MKTKTKTMQKKLFTITAVLSLLLPSVAFAQSGEVDNVAPENVSNVRAVPNEEGIELEWDPAIDNEGVENYKIYYGTKSVDTDGEKYPYEVETPDDETTYLIDGLEKGKTYFFAVTALDAARNESWNYSVEVKAISTAAAPLQAVIMVDVAEGEAPLTVSFSALKSSGEISSYAWYFDEDEVADSTEVSPSYTFETPGSIRVRLTVTGPDGKTQTASQVILIKGKEVAPEEPVTPEPPVAPEEPEITQELNMHYAAQEKSYSVDLAWKEVAGASGYILYADDGAGFKEIGRITDAKTTTFKYTEAQENKAYKFKIETLGTDGEILDTTEKDMRLPSLPESGPALLIPAALAGGAFFIRRKRQVAA